MAKSKEFPAFESPAWKRLVVTGSRLEPARRSEWQQRAIREMVGAFDKLVQPKSSNRRH